MYKHLIFTALFCLVAFKLSGAVFTVTNKADQGLGTLREALSHANANGNTETDYIYFNLSGSTVDDRTIIVNSPLPSITSSLVIDGSTEPGGALSVNGAKIIVKAAGTFTDPASGNTLLRTDCFFITGGSVFELYGLIITNFYNLKYNNNAYSGDAVFVFYGGSRVIIGAPGKGNVMYNNGSGIESQGEDHCVIQSNLLGVKENGSDFGELVQLGIAVSFNDTCLIGGDALAEGNTGFGNFTFGTLNSKTALILKSNIFNANMRYQRNVAAEDLQKNNNLHVFIFSDTQSHIAAPPTALVTGNVFGCTLLISSCFGLNLDLQSNFFGTSPDKTVVLPVYNAALHFKNTTGIILVGGSTTLQGNIFTGIVPGVSPGLSGDAVVETESSNKIDLSHNSFYCNSNPPFKYLDKGPNEKPVNITVDKLTGSTVAGTASPGSSVELFYADQECTGCQPKRYITSINADQSGKWSYSAPLDPGHGILAGATLNQESSEFSNTAIYPGNVKIHDETCDHNGAISGLVIVNAKNVQWLNENGDVVGTDLNLQNVAAGMYRIKTDQFACITYSQVFEIKKLPKLSLTTTSLQLVNDQCGEHLGAVKNIIATGGTAPYRYSWQNAAGQVVSTSSDLLSIGPDTYTLTVTDADTCGVATISYTIGNDAIFVSSPQANDVRACGNTALIQVINPVAGFGYRLYSSATSFNPLDEKLNGKFMVNLAGSKSYYISQFVGNCESARIAVQVALGPHPLTINNTFSPNGDGINDVWQIAGIENYPSASVEVFTRWGQKVFESKRYSKPFDGLFNGYALPVGTYYYIVNLGSGCDILSGSLTLVR